VFLLRYLLGFLFILIGLGYLLDPKMIVRLNALMRDTFFKDSTVLLHGKRVGSWLILIGFVLVSLGYMSPMP
jgi:hypothetical protein